MIDEFPVIELSCHVGQVQDLVIPKPATIPLLSPVT